MKLKEKMKNNNHKKFDKKKLVGTISKKHIKNGSYTMVMSVIFIAVVAITRYVSLGSLVLLAVYYIQLIIFGQIGFCKIDVPYIYEAYGIFLVLIAISYYKHWGNVKRLAAGKENKISFSKKK